MGSRHPINIRNDDLLFIFRKFHYVKSNIERLQAMKRWLWFDIKYWEFFLHVLLDMLMNSLQLSIEIDAFNLSEL